MNGQLYELDGLQQGPISFGECTEETWLPLAREMIQQRIQKYAASEIRFNLLAIVGDKLVQMQQEDQALTTQLTEVQTSENGDATLTDELQTQQVLLKQRISEEEQRRAAWLDENQRRRHNYVPLIFELLKQLA